MQKNLLSMSVLLGIVLAQAFQNEVIITEAVSSRPARESWIFVEIKDNPALKEKVAGEFAHAQWQVVSYRESGEKDDGPVIVRGLRPEDAAKDVLIGISLCLTGFLFTQLLGEEPSDGSSDDFFFFSGGKRLPVPLAILVKGFYLVGTGFLIKGIVELFMQPVKKPEGGKQGAQAKMDDLGFRLVRKSIIYVNGDDADTAARQIVGRALSSRPGAECRH